ncbi:MAG: radical SAM protein [Desulfurivibrionaceae bacterium]
MGAKPADSDNRRTLTVSELFYSIQGESSFAGYPCFFIRLSGCNLRCLFCDTVYAYEEEGTDYSLEELLKLAGRHPGALVQITGGEPLLQENVYPLMNLLLESGRQVLLETNGSISLEKVSPEVVRIMDLKCPESGMSEQMDLSNLDLLSRTDELKFVISSRLDYDWTLDILGTRFNLFSRTDLRDLPGILFSPETTRIRPSLLAAWILEDHLPVRLQLQLHKILWPEESRGL